MEEKIVFISFVTYKMIGAKSSMYKKVCKQQKNTKFTATLASN